MIKIEPYKGKSDEFLDKVIESKQESDFKSRVKTLAHTLKGHYLVYDNAFFQKKLEKISKNHGYNSKEEIDLKKLYKFSSKPFTELKNSLLEQEGNRQIDTCQYCTIDSISTFDHIAPQTIFPQFAIHPKNLFPCCSICNTKKSTKWLDSNSKFYILNLYIDEVPNVQYLFVKILRESETFSVDFFLDNKNGIDHNLFRLIECHYNTLNLCERLKQKANDVISEFVNTFESSLENNISLDTVLKVALSSCKKRSEQLGINYYKNVIELELCKNSYFLNSMDQFSKKTR